MSTATWYVLPTACVPGCHSSINNGPHQSLPQHASVCHYPSIDSISNSSSASFFDAALLPGQMCHGEWGVPLPLGDSASSNITSGGSWAGFAGGTCAVREAGAAYVGMFGGYDDGHAAAATPAAAPTAAPAAAAAAPRDTIADVLALLGGNQQATGNGDAGFAEDAEPVVPRRTAKAGMCPPPPVRRLPSIMLVPAAEVMQHMPCTAA